MKRSIFVAAIATLAAGSALAQSSVSVYGRLNMTVERTAQGGQTIYRLNDNASRLGFRGVEDLGGGMKASFLMEHRFAADTGTAATPRFWDGESWVGLEGGFGKVRLGYFGPTMAYFTTADYISMHNHDTGTSSDAFYLYSSFPARNMISYTSPSMGGLVIDAQLGLSENTQAGRTYALAANYVAGPLHLGAAYEQVGAGVPGTKRKEFGLRALYELGDFTVGAYYIRNDGAFGAGTKRDAYRGAVMYTMGPGEVHLNLGRAGDVKGLLGDQSATQMTIGYNHNLSKRTKAYTYYSRISDDARLYTGKYGTFALGVRHNF
jgi:predicted porin